MLISILFSKCNKFIQGITGTIIIVTKEYIAYELLGMHNKQGKIILH